MSENIRPAVKALVERDGKILVLRAEPGEQSYWILPGGRVEYGEKAIETLERELEEELSSEAEIGDPVGMYHFFMGKDDDGTQVVLTVFEAELENEEIDITTNPDEDYITEYCWMEPEKLVRKSSNPSLGRLIRNHYELGI